jgi:hypothetical protein
VLDQGQLDQKATVAAAAAAAVAGGGGGGDDDDDDIVCVSAYLHQVSSRRVSDAGGHHLSRRSKSGNGMRNWKGVTGSRRSEFVDPVSWNPEPPLS